jgi:hypothetical protein
MFKKVLELKDVANDELDKASADGKQYTHTTKQKTSITFLILVHTWPNSHRTIASLGNIGGCSNNRFNFNGNAICRY